MNKAAVELSDDDRLDFGELTGSVGFMLRIAQIQSFELFFQQLGGKGLKPGEFTILWLIGLNPDVRQGVLARWMRIKPAHMTKLVARMVEAGHVARTIRDDDRRSVRLSLTPEGEAFLNEHRAEFLRFHQAERAKLSNAEFTQLMQILGKLTGIEGGSR